MTPFIRIAQHRINHYFYAIVDYGNGRRSKKHGPFKYEKQAIVYMRWIYRLPKETRVVRS